jgi:hypothetical protein
VSIQSRDGYDRFIKEIKRKHGVPATTDQSYPLAATEAFDHFAPANDPVVSALIALQATEVSSRYFQVGLTTFQAQEYARRVKDTGMLNLIREVDRIIPPQEHGMINGSPNPNNGIPHHTYSIGREYTLVVYVKVITTYLDNRMAFTTFNNKMQQVGKTYHAAETHITQDAGSWLVRFWWD